MDSRASVLDHSWRLEHTHLVILEQQDDATVISARARRVAAGLGVAPWKIERLLFSFLSVAGGLLFSFLSVAGAA